MISENMRILIENPTAGLIRKMFEEGNQLKQKFGNENVFDFTLGNPDLEPPTLLVNELEKVSKDRSPLCHGYMPNAGYKETRSAMAEKTSLEQNITTSYSNIVMSIGAAGALNTVFKSLLNPDDEVLVPSPYFSEYNYYISNARGKIVPVNTLDDFSLDIKAIKKALNKKTAAILINSPNNPTGKIYSEKEIIDLSNLLRDFAKDNIRIPYIIADEPYRAITYNKNVSSIFDKYDNTIIVTSFAKNLSIPGERIGYIAVNPFCKESEKLVDALIFSTRILGFVNAPALFQRVITKSWNADCDYLPYEVRRNKIMEIMDYAGLKYFKPDGAFYLFVKIPEEWQDDDLAFCEHLKKFNILCVPGSAFSKKGWIRLAYCTKEAVIVNSREAFYKAVRKR